MDDNTRTVLTTAISVLGALAGSLMIFWLTGRRQRAERWIEERKALYLRTINAARALDVLAVSWPQTSETADAFLAPVNDLIAATEELRLFEPAKSPNRAAEELSHGAFGLHSAAVDVHAESQPAPTYDRAVDAWMAARVAFEEAVRGELTGRPTRWWHRLGWRLARMKPGPKG